jgi:hypothetical protein
MFPPPKILAISWAGGAVAAIVYAWWAVKTQDLPRPLTLILAVAGYLVLTGVAFLIIARKQWKQAGDRASQRHLDSN